ncbi:MAG: hypothetical protein R2852_04290 [Bacteroidia bacterium]
MTDKQKEMDYLFFMFHDFEITELTYNTAVLNMTIRIPWGQLWNDHDYLIKLELTGCNEMNCVYSEFLNTVENLATNFLSSEDKSTNDSKVITYLGLEVQRHIFHPPNKYELLCNSSKNQIYGGGHLTFTAENYKLFNKEGIQVELQQMEKWFDEYWKEDEVT